MTIGIKGSIIMKESNNNRVTPEVLKQVMELDEQIHRLRKERDDMFYIPARQEIIEQMKQHGLNELLLLEKDEATGEWKRIKDAVAFFNEDYDPIFSYEGEDTCYRIVRFGIIEGKLRMRLQEMPEGPSGCLSVVSMISSYCISCSITSIKVWIHTTIPKPIRNCWYWGNESHNVTNDGWQQGTKKKQKNNDDNSRNYSFNSNRRRNAENS